MERLFPRLETGGDEVVLEVAERTVSARQLRRASVAHLTRLRELGVGRGARVGVWTQPAIETLVAFVANAEAGVVSVPMDPKLGPAELEHLATDARPELCLAAAPELVAGRLGGVATHPALLEEADGPLGGRAADAAPLLVLYTSGTTGLPKGAVLSARNVAFDLDALAAAWAWTRSDTVVHALPLFHVHGLVLGLFGSMRVGGRLRWLPRFEPSTLARALGEAASGSRTTMLFAVPTMYHRLADAAEGDASIGAGLSRARLLVSGSAPLPQRDRARVEALSGQRVLERYGLTETLIDTAERLGVAGAPGSVGPPLDGVELRLVDEAGATIAVNDDATMGEVQVRGPNVFLGYLHRPEATRAVLDAEGWFSTGDLGCLRPDGSLRLVGRRSVDLIKTGGFKVGAGEVEAVLLEHPLVAEVAVIGAPDVDLGERIVAFVVTRGEVAAEALLDFAASRGSSHKRPREVHLVDALPKNAMGKVLKPALRRGLLEATVVPSEGR